ASCSVRSRGVFVSRPARGMVAAVRALAAPAFAASPPQPRPVVAVPGLVGAGAAGDDVAGAGSPLARSAMPPASVEWVSVVSRAEPAEAAETAAPAATARTAARPRRAVDGAATRWRPPA